MTRGGGHGLLARTVASSIPGARRSGVRAGERSAVAPDVRSPLRLDPAHLPFPARPRATPPACRGKNSCSLCQRRHAGTLARDETKLIHRDPSPLRRRSAAEASQGDGPRPFIFEARSAVQCTAKARTSSDDGKPLRGDEGKHGST